MATSVLNDIVIPALKKAGIVGVGRVPSAIESNDALRDLNNMLDQWRIQRWMNWGELDVSFVAPGTNPITIGPGGDIAVTPRPTRLEWAFQRQLVNPPGLQIDTPLEVITSRDEYSRLSLKTLVSFSLYVFLDTAYPMGNLYLYPIPNANIYEVHVGVRDVIPVLALVTTIDGFPPGYAAAMTFNLAVWLRQAYGKGLRPDTELNKLAANSLSLVKDANLQVPELVMPKSLIVQTSGYNILSDQFGVSN